MQIGYFNPVRRFGPLAFHLLIATIAFAFCYTGVVAALARWWAASAVYSYGLAVPLVSGYLVWTKKSELRALTLAPDYAFGVPLALFTGVLLAVGHLGALV